MADRREHATVPLNGLAQDLLWLSVYVILGLRDAPLGLAALRGFR